MGKFQQYRYSFIIPYYLLCYHFKHNPVSSSHVISSFRIIIAYRPITPYHHRYTTVEQKYTENQSSGILTKENFDIALHKASVSDRKAVEYSKELMLETLKERYQKQSC